MTPVVYLHIGMNKTGTTAIQHCLYGLRETLRSRGVLYPDTGVQRATPSHAEFSRAAGFATGFTVDQARLRAMRDTLHAEIDRYRPARVILSSEMFVKQGPLEPLREALAGFPVKVIVYFRRHDHWWESLYAQHLKTASQPPRHPPGAEAFIRDRLKNGKLPSADYRWLAERWATAFGRDNLIVRPHERAQNVPDLVTDFMAAAGCADALAGLDTAVPWRNERLPADYIQLLETFRRINAPQEVRDRLRTWAVQTGLRQPAGERNWLTSPAFRRELVDRAAGDYAWLAREFLGRADGRLFLEPPPDPGEPWSPPAALTARFLAEATIRAMTDSHT